ncbi:hypothetical protein [Deinococcus sp. NW-56]|uniref:hypothetical protein n=1 Tax=Deinococcus sp. NW-56 TaxID=2080419 RepID=UPI000CF4F51F|nr:hypothetical protein [Deinococcus sp. NW-56]
MSAPEEMTVGSLSGLLEGGEVAVELRQNLDTDELVLCLTVEMEGGTEAEVIVHEDEAVEIATDLLMFAQRCRQHNNRGLE